MAQLSPLPAELTYIQQNSGYAAKTHPDVYELVFGPTTMLQEYVVPLQCQLLHPTMLIPISTVHGLHIP